MIRGTTPTHIFDLPFEVDLIKKVIITYKQGENKVLEKTEADCTLENKCIKLTLTQEETLLFDSYNNVKVQIKVLTFANDVLASAIMQKRVDECLNEEVLV